MVHLGGDGRDCVRGAGSPLVSRGRQRCGELLCQVDESAAQPWIIAPRTTLRLIEPPMRLQPIHKLMPWTPRSEDYPEPAWSSTWYTSRTRKV
jgi:hypothetical protein